MSTKEQNLFSFFEQVEGLLGFGQRLVKASAAVWALPPWIIKPKVYSPKVGRDLSITPSCPGQALARARRQHPSGKAVKARKMNPSLATMGQCPSPPQELGSVESQ